MKQKTFFFLAKLPLAMLVFLMGLTVSAQFQINAPLYIGDGGSVYLSSGSCNFGVGGQTVTGRTDLVYGKLIFGNGVTTSGESNSHFLDGYGRFEGVSPFLFPTGQSSVYAPILIQQSAPGPVDVGYFRDDAMGGGRTDLLDVSLVSSQEYWRIESLGTSTISLIWRANSVLSDLVNSISDLTIAGYDGDWFTIPSTVDGTSILGGSSSLTAGSITSTSLVDLSRFRYFTFAAKGNACAPLIASSGNTKTWTGVWSPSAPTIADPVVIDAPYAGGTFSCNSLVLNFDVTLADGENVDVVNGVTGSGKIIMSSEASVVQRASAASAPTIELTKRTRSIMRRFDYIYWGTPIAGNFFQQLAGAQASTAAGANAFDYKYKYVSGAGGGWQALTAIETGKGFITRIKAQAPFTDATTMDYINFKFTGVANNGDITVPVTNNPNSLNGGTSHVLLANPYPSAIDADKFLSDNADLDGVVYLWTAANANAGVGASYTQADYIAYTRAGAVVPAPIAATFDGKIASGQGFLVKSLTSSGTATFTNCMRISGSNTGFFRSRMATESSTPKDRYKLNMTGLNGVFSQILIAYLPEATLGFDRLYDAGRNSVSTAQLYSVFEGDGRKLAINARPTFVDSDVVPLGISKADTTTESFTIGIAEKEGIFNTSEVNVFLFDRDQSTYYNLADGDYTFTSSSTALNNRFEIVYNTAVLSNPQFKNLNVRASLKDLTLKVNANEPITEIEIFDITGRKIESTKVNGTKNYVGPFVQAQAVYIAKIKFVNGTIATIKLINEN